MKKKAAALLFCLLLLLQTTAPLASAAGNVYFVAVGENILPVTDETMPFWNDGFLYIASSSFSGIGRESLGISHNYNSNKQMVILYNSNGMSLRFELGKNYALDRNDVSYSPGAIQRGGVTFVPVSTVAKFFGLQYSVLDVTNGHLVWLRYPGYVLSERTFADAATYQLASRYEEYLKNRVESSTSQGGLTPEVGKEIEGKSIYLCLKAGENTALLLDTLDRYNAQAAFFCTTAFLEQQGDLLRRMTITGQTIGILADGNTDIPVSEQLSSANAALERATCGKTRLVMVENGSEQLTEEIISAGYSCLQPDLDRSSYTLSNASNALTLLRRISARQGDVTVWLADTANEIGLRSVLHTTDSVDGYCRTLTETA